MKKILGLDLGTNSIGWALIEQDFADKRGQILGMGSRIIPMSQDILGDFDKGNSVSQTAARTSYRSIRRLRERHLLRRERLHRVLNILGFLPEHYASQIDFEKRLGQFLDETEPKLAYSKTDFIFKRSFEEMLEDFKKNQPTLLKRKNKKGEDAKVPYDWTIYYLRKKALTYKIEKEELAWLLLGFNQKRGYYQLRGEEEEENPNKLVEFHSLKIVDVVPDNQANSKGDLWYSLHLENGWIYRRSSKIDLSDWKDKIRNFIVTTDLNDDGSIKTDKEGGEKRSFRAPGEDDWTLLKKKTEQEIDESAKTVGAFIYDALLQNPNQKIRGRLVRTIERKFYKDELKAILSKQVELQPELFKDDLYNDCVRDLYRHNEAHQLSLSKRDFVHLLVDDIIFYQRPLKSKKSSIGDCSLEFREYKAKDQNGKEVTKTEHLKAIPKSHPLYQEFRVWQWLYNLKIHKKDDETDVTLEFLQSIEDKERLFGFLMAQKEADHKSVLKHLLEPLALKGKALNAEIAKYRWNYVYDPEKDESKKYPCNETGYDIRRRLGNVKNVSDNFLTPQIEQHLWHVIYSVTDKKEFEKALKSFAIRHGLDEESFIESFRKFKPFDSDYASYSEKAIKKLLPLMRLGKYWNWEAIDHKTKGRIDNILTGEYDEEMKNRVREKAIHLTDKEHFQGLQLWLAQYIVYDRHSEAALAGKWKSVADLEKYLEEFKQHSLRNPIVEQVVTETLRVVRDIWIRYGNGAENYFDEIHIELGREMKNTAEERKRITSQISDNENTNLRIKALIAELKSHSDIENVRPYSPMQQEALKIYEDGVLNSGIEIPDEIIKISKTAQPTKSELIRYKLWLEQKYRSPYTGQVIPLSRLFTEDYQIEHIIPQSRYFDDSFNNKVICEAAVNQLKDKQLGLEFIKSHQGEMVETGNGKPPVMVFNENDYKDFVAQHYNKNRGKRNKLLLEEIPEKMIERQLNDTRYISKFISNLLANIVRSDKDDEGVNSKKIIPGNGKITSTLKQDWGLNDVWNDLILPRFERMNELTNSTAFTSKNKEGHTIPTVPMELSKGFQKKRIDHRHHALDALVIACATRDHVNLLNNQSAKSDSRRYDLQHKLRNTEKWIDKEGREREKFTDFKKPWKNFASDSKNELEKVVISFKQNLRIINKASNRYQKYENGKKVQVKQKGVNWAIRKSLHTPMPYGKKTYDFDILEIAKSVGKREHIIDDGVKAKVEKVLAECGGKITEAQKVLKENPINDDTGDPIKVTAFKIKLEKFRKRQPITELSNRGQGGIKTLEDAVKYINKVAELSLRNDLLGHLREADNDIDKAFSAEGLENFNTKRKTPVYKLPIAESGSGRFAVGNKIGTRHKWVEADKGTNLFLAIYTDENGNRSYNTIPLNIVIERQKQGLYPVPDSNEIGNKLLTYLSPSDLIYVPSHDEIESPSQIDFENLNSEHVKRIYKMVSTTQDKLECVPIHYASPILVNEMGSNNKSQNTIDGVQIKSVCLKLKVDRLGNISKA
ncbi:MAG: HNH endonuclease domain-containing protein [Imperialibacter sp.]|uniref:type II CRISPR RNA-guided endonuclease Cas9 n=1 Tax=Imperialibacter sp. TaxID=2038411 RepID=UPI0032EE5EE5